MSKACRPSRTTPKYYRKFSATALNQGFKCLWLFHLVMTSLPPKVEALHNRIKNQKYCHKMTKMRCCSSRTNSVLITIQRAGG